MDEQFGEILDSGFFILCSVHSLVKTLYFLMRVSLTNKKIMTENQAVGVHKG